MMPRKLSDEQRRALAEAYAAGAAVKVLAWEYGIHESTVSKIASEFGLKRLHMTPKGRSARALGLAAMRLGLTVQDLELLAQSRPNPPMPGGQDRYGEQRESI